MLDTNSSIPVPSVDFSKLQELLEAGDWVTADNETLAILLKLAGLENEDKLNVEHIEKIADSDLKAIDQLWVKYSDGRFGFSVQRSLYNQNIYEFCWTVEWLDLSPDYYASQGRFYFTFSYNITDSTPPKGHLPACIIRSALKHSPLEYGRCSWGTTNMVSNKRRDAEFYIARWCGTNLEVLRNIHLRSC